MLVYNKVYFVVHCNKRGFAVLIAINELIEPLTKVTIMNNVISYCARVVYYVLRINNPTKFSWDRNRINGGAPTRPVKYTGRVPFVLFFLSFLATRTAKTREPISKHDSSKDTVWSAL